MKRRLALLLVVSVGAGAWLAAQARSTAAPLEIYVIDTEGGKATLFISPSGESLLIDSGNPGGRDTERILALFGQIGLKQIDHLVSTHYHIDHIGGLAELSRRVPIRHYWDHGPTVEEKEQLQGFQAAYAEIYGQAKHTVLQPGDRIAIAGLDWRIVSAGGKVLKAPLSGGGRPNPACTISKPKENTRDPENGQSVGSVITYGQFRAIDLGDLLWNNELDLMCPENPIGTVDLYLVSHHGQDSSGSEALVHALRPRVAVMQNGPRKGGAVPAMQIMRSSPGLEDVWQLHWSYTAGVDQNSAGVFVANVDDPAVFAATLTGPPRGGPAPNHLPAHAIKILAESTGTFTVTNMRNGYSKTYVKKPQ
jgi:competence protein ComEC